METQAQNCTQSELFLLSFNLAHNFCFYKILGINDNYFSKKLNFTKYNLLFSITEINSASMESLDEGMFVYTHYFF